jgi:hypothetical protein
MSSQLKSDTDSLKAQTARANGAKSRGPATPQGRAASSRNSLRHGFTAASVVLPTESSEDFQALLDSYAHQFHPQGGVEMDLIQTMAAARWRLRRICTIETTLLNNEMTRRAKDCKRELNDPDDLARLAWVFRNLADNGQSLALLTRYEGALNRSYDRAFKQLLLLQSARHRAQPNEPKPGPSRAPRPAPITPSVVSPIPAPRPGSRNTIGLLYRDSRSSSQSPATPGIAEPGPDPAPKSPPSSPPC